MPTVTAFDAVCAELQLGWTRSRVIRAWGRWRTADAALFAGKVPLTARQVGYQRRFRGRLTYHRPALAALRLFVESNPPSERKQDYDRWAREQNHRLVEGEALFPTALTALRHLRLRWLDALRVAHGEADLADVPEWHGRRHESLVSGPIDLISISGVREIFGVSRAKAEGRAREKKFPTPVVIFGRTRGWVRSDVEAHAAGQPTTERRENEFRHLYLDAKDLGSLIGLSANTIKYQKKATFPPSTGRLSANKYWLRSDVDRWIAANQALVSKRLKQRPGRPRQAVERKELVTLADLGALFGLSADRVGRLADEDGFPDPVAEIGRTRIWDRGQVDAYLLGRSTTKSQVAAQEVVGSRELSEMSGVPLNSVRSLTGVPRPAGTAGRKNYWWRRDVEQWLVERANTELHLAALD